MTNARSSLLRHVQAFFETELCGVYAWGACVHRAAEKASPPPGRKFPIYGRYKEIVSLSFDGYDLTVFSSSEVPPLGWISLEHAGGVIVGPLDDATWKKIGEFIRSQKARISHG